MSGRGFAACEHLSSLQLDAGARSAKPPGLGAAAGPGEAGPGSGVGPVLQFFTRLRRHASLDGASPYFKVKKWKLEPNQRASSLDTRGELWPLGGESARDPAPGNHRVRGLEPAGGGGSAPEGFPMSAPKSQLVRQGAQGHSPSFSYEAPDSSVFGFAVRPSVCSVQWWWASSHIWRGHKCGYVSITLYLKQMGGPFGYS